MKSLFRLLLAFAFLFAGIHGFRLGVLPVIQSLFHPGDSATSAIRRLGVLTCAVLAYWAYVRWVERRPASELRWTPRAIALGGTTGMLLILVPIAVLFAVGVYAAIGYHGLQPGLCSVAGVILIAATLEELAFRGILFRIVEARWGTACALTVQALAFAWLHLENLDAHATWLDIASTLATVALLGALWSMVFVHSRNLWVTTANHAAWNFTIVLSGLPLSGGNEWRPLGLFVSQYRGAAWLTGGEFGPEASALTIVLAALAVAGLIRRARAGQRWHAFGVAGLRTEEHWQAAAERPAA